MEEANSVFANSYSNIFYMHNYKYMGNCNSESAEVQKCRGCGIGDCPCTAGLDSLCGRCDPSWKRNIPGTYDAQYDAWMRANPRPVRPLFDPQPPLNAGDFICVQCTQCQDFSGITAGGTVDINDPSQAMQCIGKMQQELDKRANANTVNPNAPGPIPHAAPQAPQQATNSALSNKTIILGAVFMLMFIMMIVIALLMQGGNTRTGRYDGTFEVNSLIAGACEACV
jgi:hypothetical protein